MTCPVTVNSKTWAACSLCHSPVLLSLCVECTAVCTLFCYFCLFVRLLKLKIRASETEVKSYQRMRPTLLFWFYFDIWPHQMNRLSRNLLCTLGYSPTYDPLDSLFWIDDMTCVSCCIWPLCSFLTTLKKRYWFCWGREEGIYITFSDALHPYVKVFLSNQTHMCVFTHCIYMSKHH